MLPNACHWVRKSAYTGPAFAQGLWHVSMKQVTSKITRYQQLLNFQLKNFNILNNSVLSRNISYFRNCHLANNSTKPEVGKGFLKNYLTRWRKYCQDKGRQFGNSPRGPNSISKYLSVVWSCQNMLQMNSYPCFSSPWKPILQTRKLRHREAEYFRRSSNTLLLRE